MFKFKFQQTLLIFMAVLIFGSGVLYSRTKPLYHYRGKARPFLKQKRYQEAVDVYMGAAKDAEDDIDQALFIKHAIDIVFKYQKDFDKAMELAKTVRSKERSGSIQLILLVDKKMYKEAIERFKDEDISKWPFEYRLESFYARARAYYSLNNYDKAEEDLKNAVESNGKVVIRGNACKMLADMYLNDKKDKDKALEAYKKALTISKANYAWRNRCFISMVDILIEKNREDEAADAFDKVNYDRMPSDYWRGMFYISQAKTQMKLGNNGQAATILTKLLRTNGIPGGYKETAQIMIDEIIKDMSEE